MKISIKASRLLSLLLGPLCFLLIILLVDADPEKPEITYTLAVAIFMAIWWITEVISLAITSLLPLVLFPLLGVMDGGQTASTYFNHVIFLFIGGFMVALAMQRWDLHKRIALLILKNIGASPGRILLGFMLATAFLSMWISNTATAMMMIPILISVIAELEKHFDKVTIAHYSTGLLLGIAYSASIGGVATLVGTPPNLAFVHIFHIMFPEAPDISFARWFAFALPLTVVFFGIAWIYLYFIFKPKKGAWSSFDKSVFKRQYKQLGKTRWEEKVILTIFILLALLWLFRSDIKAGDFVIPGWTRLLDNPDYMKDGNIAILMALLLYLIPSRNRPGQQLMDWETTKKLPWNIVLLFGGGFALAHGFKESGLTLWLVNQLEWLNALHVVLIILMVAFAITFLTELTSNTATTQMILPVLAGLAISTSLNPLLLMIPATIAASMAFMLPVATPPNAIVFGTGRLRVKTMAKNGLALNFIGIILVTLAVYLLAIHIFGIDVNAFPEWAAKAGE